MVKFIAIDIGGTNLRASLVENNKIIEYIKKNTPKNKNDFLKELYSMINELITKDVKAIGIGSPGPLSNGIIKNPPNIPLHNFNLKKAIENKFHKRVVIENDAHCVALAELKLGCRKKNFVILTFGTGVGGGIVIDGRLYTGRGYAGEIGHIVIDNGKSFEILWKEVREYIRKNFGREIFIKDLIKMNNPEAVNAIEKVVKIISMGIASAINILDPEVVILNGGFKETGDVLLKRIRREAKKYIVLPRETPIEWSKLEHPGTLGAGLLVSG